MGQTENRNGAYHAGGRYGEQTGRSVPEDCAEQPDSGDIGKAFSGLSAEEGLHRAVEPRDMVLNSKVRDSSSKIIFDNHMLCSQFLRDYVDLPYLKNVKPEDIEDVSDQYVTLFAEERNSDRVKRVRIRAEGTPFFLVSLIEHKTQPDYNVCMQIFRYMVHIWDTYEKEAESVRRGMAKRSDFLYPPILPIIYYEGAREWKVPLDFRSRVREGENFGRYIPDFEYYLVPLRDYSNEALMAKKDEISLVMLVNKLQTVEDIENFRRLPGGEIESILRHSPQQMVDTIAEMLQAFLLKINVPVSETEQLTDRVRKKKMGELFADMEKIDIQAERQKMAFARKQLDEERKQMEERWEEVEKQQKQVEEQRKQAEEQRKQAEEQRKQAEEQQKQVEEQQKQVEEQRKQAEEQRKQAEEQQKQVEEQQKQVEEQRKQVEEQQKQIEETKRQAELTEENSIKSIIGLCRELGTSKEAAARKLMEKKGLNQETALEKTTLYW